MGAKKKLLLKAGKKYCNRNKIFSNFKYDFILKTLNEIKTEMKLINLIFIKI